MGGGTFRFSFFRYVKGVTDFLEDLMPPTEQTVKKILLRLVKHLSYFQQGS
jgi:hypothetical protein